MTNTDELLQWMEDEYRNWKRHPQSWMFLVFQMAIETYKVQLKEREKEKQTDDN
jgi:hypothetical protein